MADQRGSDRRAVVRGLVEKLRADPSTVDGVVAAARAVSPPVAGLPLREVHRHIGGLLQAVAEAFVRGTGLRDEQVRAADHLATDRAIQGIPLSALLDGYQAGRAHIMMRLIDAAREAGLTADTLLDSLLELDGYANELQNKLIHAYRETELNLARTAHAVRVQALRDLLHGEGDPGLAVDAGLDPARRYHCLVADVSDPRRARQVESVPDEVSAFVDGYLCAVAPRVPAHVGDVLVVAAPAVPPAELAGAYALCRSALAAASRRGLTGLRPLTALAVPVALDAHPRLGALLAAEHLGALDPSDEFHRLLAGTALAYLEHGSRADLAAASLHVHPNTVKHRLKRLAELTGFDGGPDLLSALAWWWALAAWLE